MAPRVFVDSDVVIDFFTDREPFANPASSLFESNERGEIIMYISAVSINNIYYIVRKYLGHKATLKIIEELTEITEIIGATKKEILNALASDFRDFEDSIQHSSAITVNNLEAIVTRNVKDYSNSEIAVFTAENYIKSKMKDK